MKFKILVALSLLIFLGTANAVTKIACIGDSITWGYNSTDKSSTGFEPGLQALLGSGYSVQNDGYSGATARRSDSKSYWTCGLLANVWALKPDIITIMLGTNDSRPNLYDANPSFYGRDYGALIDTLNTLSSKPKIYIVFPPPNWDDTTNRPCDSNVVKEIATLKQIAKTRGLPTIDQHTPLKPFPGYFKDHLHPNAAGYDTIAHVMYRGLKSTDLVEPSADHKMSAEINHFSVILSAVNAVPNLDSRMVPGASYSIKAFDAKGALSAEATVKNSEEVNQFGKKLQSESHGLKILEFQRVL